MSGFAGCFSRTGSPVDPDVLRRMMTTLPHRGAADWQRFVDGSVAVAGGQMASAEGGNLILVGDVRVDNREDVERLLDGPISQFDDITLVAELRSRYGSSFVEHLEGDFAFVVINLADREVTCYRDHFGARPFCYSLTGQFLLVASEITPVLASGVVGDEVDRIRVEDFFVGRLSDQERTFYKAVKRLQPATEMVVTDRDIRAREFWSIESAPVQSAPIDDLAEQFRRLFMNAVRVRAKGERVNCMLSGGLDSSSVVASAASMSPKGEDVRSFTVQFPYLEGRQAERADESRYARAVVESSGVTAHTLSGDTKTPLGTLKLMTEIHGQPFEVPNAYLDAIAMEAVRDQGGGVLLTGLEGDLTVSHGDGYLLELGFAGRWKEFVGEADALVARSGATPEMIMERYGAPILENLFQLKEWSAFGTAIRELAGAYEKSSAVLAWNTGLRRWIRQKYYRVTQKETFEDRSRLSLIRPDYPGRRELLERLRESTEKIDNARTQREHHTAFLTSGYPASLLEFSERNAAFYGLDIRHPFFDKALVEFSVGLPGSAKLSNGWTRYILRMAMEQILPDEVQWRADKAVLAPNFVYLMKAEPPEKVQKLANSAVDAFSDILGKASVNSLLERRKYATLWNILGVGEWVLHKRN